jgi:polyisoprenoid-binding protein YceI
MLPLGADRSIERRKAMSWSLDPHHTHVGFSAKHLGVATVRGRFTKVEAALELDDPEDPTTGRGTVTIDAASVDTGNEQRDGHLRGADFLDVEKYPTITFTLMSVERAGDDYKVVGGLTIKDVTKDVTLNYEHSGVVVDPFGNTKVGGSLAGTIERSQWGLQWNVALARGGWLVSEKVKIEIDGELAQDKEEAAESASAEAATRA